jgi:hypothetical protein
MAPGSMTACRHLGLCGATAVTGPTAHSEGLPPAAESMTLEADSAPAASGLEKTGGVCVLCERTIDAVRERWIVEHNRALNSAARTILSTWAPRTKPVPSKRQRMIIDARHAPNGRRFGKSEQKPQTGRCRVGGTVPGSRPCQVKSSYDSTSISREELSEGREQACDCSEICRMLRSRSAMPSCYQSVAYNVIV